MHMTILTTCPSIGRTRGPTNLNCGIGPNALTTDDNNSKEKAVVYDSSARIRECSGCVESRRLARSRASSTRFGFRSELEKHVFTRVTGRPGTKVPTAPVKAQSRMERLGMVRACLRERALMDTFSGVSSLKSEMCNSESRCCVEKKDTRCASQAKSQWKVWSRKVQLSSIQAYFKGTPRLRWMRSERRCVVL